MNYAETLDYIHNTPKFSRELGNRMLQKLLNHIGNPENKLRFIHIAGTNGKGSVAIMLSKILQSAGYLTGLFISPYITQFNERMQINSEMIDNSDLARITTDIRNVIEAEDAPVSEFALDTAIALKWFAENSCDIVILETGLGGRLDATNVIPEAELTILTAIGFDHTQYLGDTIEQITKEKCGIMKNNCSVVSYPIQDLNAMNIIEEEAKKNNSILYVADKPEIISPNEFILQGNKYNISLSGDFQAYNAATVLKSVDVLNAHGFNITLSDVENGLLAAINPGRLEKINEKIMLDGAHNSHAALALCNTLKNYNRPVYLCVAMMEDKNYEETIKILSECADGIIATQLPIPRCCPADEIAAVANKYSKNVYIEKQPEKAVEKALNIMKQDGLLCICGSLYLISEIRPYLLKKYSI